MNFHTTTLRIALILLIGASTLSADGLLRPTNASYPKNFLRSRMTRVDVTLHGQIAVTKVYQEFVNEWDKPTGSVYSFPLPMDARATDFFYWSNDTMYQAVLKVKEQATNPGTGEGGIDALVNAYMGKNALRVLLPEVSGGAIQKTQMEYISLCTYEGGRIRYTFPFNTQDFVTAPLESFTFAVHIDSPDDITDASIIERSGARTTKTDARHWDLTLDQSKMFPSSDLTLEYGTSDDAVNVEMYAASNDTMDGHFVMMVKPRQTLDSAGILPKNAVFTIDASVYAAGTALTASKAAVAECLKKLRPGDFFNVVIFNSSASSWSVQSQPATSSNIASASSYIASVSATGSPALSAGITRALSMFTSDTLNNLIMLFSDGQALADPKQIAALNTRKAAIFPIAIGASANRPRIEAMAYENYGFPTFLSLSDPLVDRILGVFAQVNYPVMKDVRMEFGTNVYGLLPRTLATMYHGSRFFITGRYKKSGTSALSLAGYSVKGPQVYNYMLAFPSAPAQNKFAERFWGKEQIDAIERQIALYGQTDSLKALDIKYSLLYNIRCQFTSYIADKSKPSTGVEDAEQAIEAVTLVRSGVRALTLSWTMKTGEAVASCTVSKSASPNGPFTRLAEASPRAMTYTDYDAPSGSVAYYKLEITTRSGRRLTRIVSSEAAALPGAFALRQNYPNPFNPETSVRFDVARTSDVRLALYDIMGREVALLVNERLAPGAYERTWNAARLPSGIYFCRMQAGSFTSVRKMILQK